MKMKDQKRSCWYFVRRYTKKRLFLKRQTSVTLSDNTQQQVTAN